MAKRKFVCIACGNAPQELHSLCLGCHNFSLDDRQDFESTKAGNDYLSRCSEEDCWVCDSLAWSNKRTRPFKHSKKNLCLMASGRKGKTLQEQAIVEMKKRGIENPYEKKIET